MKRYAIALMFFVLSMLASYAQAQVNLDGLTTAQKAELTLQAEKMKESAVPPMVKAVQASVPSTEAVTKWAEAGKSLAVGLGAGAREVGVAVNEFSETRVGKITTYIIIWKLMGKEILAFGVGIFILLIVQPVVWKVTRRICGQVTEYENSTFFWIPIRRKKMVRIDITSEEQGWFLFISVAVQVALFFIALHMLPF